MGSKDITLGFGSGTEATSMTSIKFTFVSHDDIGEMVVGRVNVDVSMYVTVPRSNCDSRLATRIPKLEIVSHLYC